MVAFIPDMVQINIYGLTLAEVLKKGANIPHWLESFGIGDCVVFDVPRSAGQKQLSPHYIRSPITSFNSSIPSSRADLPPYNEEIKIEEPDNFEHAPDSPARCSTPIQSDADLFNCTISTIHQDRQENELDMRTMEPILEEVEDEPLTVDEHTIAEAERPVLLNLSTSQSNFFKTLFTDSVMDVMIDLIDAVVEAQDKPCHSVDVPGNLTEVADQFHSVALQDTLGETSFDSANEGESVLVENEEEAPNKEQSLPESGHTDCPVDQMEVLNSYQQNSFGRESFGAAFDQENFEDADFDYDGDSMFKDAEGPLPNENNRVIQPIENPEKINLTGIKINLGRGGNRGRNPVSQGDGLRVNVGRSKKAITKDTTIVRCGHRGCTTTLVLRRGYGRDRLLNHARTHLNLATWKCIHCDYASHSEQNVRYHHQITHRGAKFGSCKQESLEDFKRLLKMFRVCFPGWNANIPVCDIDPEYLTEATRKYKYLDIDALIKLQTVKRGTNQNSS